MENINATTTGCIESIKESEVTYQRTERSARLWYGVVRDRYRSLKRADRNKSSREESVLTEKDRCNAGEHVDTSTPNADGDIENEYFQNEHRYAAEDFDKAENGHGNAR